jgi:hypothetical protein
LPADLTAAWAELAEEYRPVLDVLLHLPVMVIDDLDEARARAVDQLAGRSPHSGSALPLTYREAERLGLPPGPTRRCDCECA